MMPGSCMESNQNGKLEAFRVTSAGVVQHKWQNTAGTWNGSSGMTDLANGGVAIDHTGGINAILRSDGCIELSAVSTGGSFARAFQNAPNGAGSPAWSAWVTTF